MHTDQSIRQRKTEKVLATGPLPCRDRSTTICELVALAGFAPFHRVCEDRHRQQGLAGIEPWRFHILDATSCRRLLPLLPTENAGKIPAMLAAADALLIATWLPSGNEPSKASTSGSEASTAMLDDGQDFAPTVTNVEHIAAASAAIENLLLAATARGIRNYWSSGGVLRLPSVFQQLGIPTTELLLGAIFLFPDDIGDAELATSKLRDLRTPPEHWSRWITLPEASGS